MSTKARLYIVLTALAGTTALIVGLDPWKSDDLVRFVCYLLISTLASGLKVNLPGITGTMSVNFLFILLGIIELSLPETMLIAWTATLFQSLWKTKTRAVPVQILFKPLEVVPDDRLKLSFDMPADQYPIFCELMKFGIFGRVKLSEPGLATEVSVKVP